MSSSTTVALFAAALLAGVAGSALYARERNRTYQAEEQFRSHAAELRELQVFLDDRGRSRPRLDEGLARCLAALDRYGVPADGSDDGWERSPAVRYLSDADRRALRGDVGEVFYLMARVAHWQTVTAGDAANRDE